MSDANFFQGIIEPLEATEPEQPYIPEVSTPGEATFLFKRIRRLKQQMEEYEQIMKAEIARVKDWYKQQCEKAEKEIIPLEIALKQYIKMKRETIPDYNLNTPDGTVHISRTPAKWNWPDDEKLVATLKAAGKLDLIKVAEAPMKADIKRAFTIADGQAVDPDTGEVLDGITITEGEEKMIFRFNKEEKAA